MPYMDSEKVQVDDRHIERHEDVNISRNSGQAGKAFAGANVETVHRGYESNAP
jgi:hypothetical protein